MARPVSAPKTPRGAPRPRDLTKEMFVSRLGLFGVWCLVKSAFFAGLGFTARSMVVLCGVWVVFEVQGWNGLGLRNFLRRSWYCEESKRSSTSNVPCITEEYDDVKCRCLVWGGLGFGG